MSVIDPQAEFEKTMTQSANSDDGKGGESITTMLADFVKSRGELIHDSNKDAFFTEAATGITMRIESRSFRDWICAGYYKDQAKIPRSSSVKEVIEALCGTARFDAEMTDVSLRVTGSDNQYFLDLGMNQASSVVEIKAGNWQVLNSSATKFYRIEAMQPLPLPIKGGDLGLLWRYANVPPQYRLLVIAWLCDCLRPNTPYPILEILGEQGSAKSTTQAMLRRLIDPNACDLRSAPKQCEDLFVAARSNHLLCYENLSHLSPPIQDSMCVISTGGGHATRKLYTNDEEAVLKAKRPIVVNGISAILTAQDVLDRAVSIELPPITDRRDVAKLNCEFDECRGAILGGLLDVFAKALGLLPTVSIPPNERPRLNEFAYLGIAIEQAMGELAGTFMHQFDEQKANALGRSLESSPVAGAFIQWFEATGRAIREMTAGDILSALTRYKPEHTDAWPKSAKGFAEQLRRLTPALRSYGIEVKSLGKVGGSIKWMVRDKSSKLSPASPASLGSPDDEGGDQDVRTSSTSNENLSPRVEVI